MEYTITIRFCSEDLELLKSIKCNFYQTAELYIKGQPLRENSKTMIRQNLLILYKSKVDYIDELSLINLLDSLNFKSSNLKKRIDYFECY